MPAIPQVVFVTDRNLLRPTLIALWSLLRQSSSRIDVHLWGDRLTEADWAAVERISANHNLVPRQIAPEDLNGATGPGSHISSATMGRLFIPRHLDGRVLYIDGDTLITGDLAPLFTYDTQGAAIGAVRDYVTANWIAMKRRDNGRRQRRLETLHARMNPSRYFNAGVLLLDCTVIRNQPDLHRQMEDVIAASATEFGDQDHLNFLFSEQVILLNPALNSSWGRNAEQRRFAELLGGEGDETAPMTDRILHFHGPRKPWLKSRLDFWTARGQAVLRYRRAMRQFLHEYPDLA